MNTSGTGPAWGFIFALLFMFSATMFAGEFDGLQPGSSRKADADRVLGTPVREVVRGERYDYSPAKYDATRISVKFSRDSQVIESIDVYLKGSFSRSQYVEWFKLAAPVKSASGTDGRLVEYYAPEGLALHYAGRDDKSVVEFFSHYDPRLLLQVMKFEPVAPGEPQSARQVRQVEAPQPAVQPQAAVQLPAPLQPRPDGAAPAPRARVGLLIGPQDGQGMKIVDVAPSSPAARAGLRSGDVILEFAETGLYELRVPPARLASLLAAQPPGQPVRLLVQRGPGRFETAVTPEVTIVDPREAELAKGAYDEGRKLMEAGDYAGAAARFNESIAHHSGQPASYSALAESFFRRGDRTGEIEALKRGVAAAPSFRLYSLLGFSLRQTERFDEAIEAFGKAVALMPSAVRDAAVYEQLGYCQMRKRRYREALGPFEAAFKINPRSPGAAYFLGGCHDALGNRDQAMQFYRTYIGLGDNNEQRVKYARGRLDKLSKGLQPGAGAAEQLLKMLESVVKEATKPDKP